MKDPPHAWHYTTAQGLIEILTSDRLWATSAAYMNDRDEIEAGRAALRRAAKRRDPPLDEWQHAALNALGVNRPSNPQDLFLLCASQLADSLTLWRSYGMGREAEYSIGLDRDVTLLPIQQDEHATHPDPPPPGWYDAERDSGPPSMRFDPDEPSSAGGGWHDVQYLGTASQAADKELTRLLTGMRKPLPLGNGTISSSIILEYIHGLDPTFTFKHSGFRDEREVRAAWTVQPSWRFIKYRSGRFGVTPYIEVAAPTSPSANTEQHSGSFLRPAEAGRLPVRTIWIGPTRAAEQAKKSLKALLDVQGYGHVEIRQSSTPYR